MQRYTRFSAFGVNALPRFGDVSLDAAAVDETRVRSPRYAVYVHVPYCRTLCEFCMLRRGSLARAEIPDTFLEALDRDFEATSAASTGAVADSLYVGGGTPSLLSGRQVSRLLASARRWFDFLPDAEVTFEGEAASLRDEELLATLVGEGVARVSFGVQTFDPEMRALLGRSDSLEDVRRTREALDVHGFRDVNVDLMYALPGTTLASVESDLDELHALAPTSVDCHPLKYPSCSKRMLAEMQRSNRTVPSAATRIAMYTRFRSYFLEQGYTELFADQYAVERRAGPQRYLRHLYGLDGGEYVGVGPGARSHYDDVGVQKTLSVANYVEAARGGRSLVERSVRAPLADNYVTCFPKRNDLLTHARIDASPSREFFWRRLGELVRLGYVESGPAGFRLTNEGTHWYQNLQEDLLSESQSAAHQARARTRELALGGSAFDVLGRHVPI
jgi:oxygen-independent coproporphyrinogen-3 oxidase